MKRDGVGWAIMCAGLAILLFVPILGVILIVLGLGIVFNKNEDKIEEINFKKIKGRK